MKNILQILIIVAIIFATVYVKGKYFPSETSISVIETVRDTIFQDKIVYKELPAPNPDTIQMIDTVKLPPDTIIKEKYAELYKDFHSKYFYNDTLKDDTSALIVVDDKISRNQILKRELYYQNRMPTKILNTKKVAENQFFIGMEAGLRTMELGLMYQRNNFQYKVGYDFSKPTGIRIGVYTSFGNIKKVIF